VGANEGRPEAKTVVVVVVGGLKAEAMAMANGGVFEAMAVAN
jgi:hypothetical protein